MKGVLNRWKRDEEQLFDVPLFRGISKEEARFVSSLTTRLESPAGSVLARQGDLGREFMILLEGQVDVRCNGEIVATRGPGDHVGEIALLSSRPRTATLVATTPVVFEVIASREFASLLAEVDGVSQRIHESAADRLAELVRT
jgi:CRP-like cAMP-binding protein